MVVADADISKVFLCAGNPHFSKQLCVRNILPATINAHAPYTFPNWRKTRQRLQSHATSWTEGESGQLKYLV